MDNDSAELIKQMVKEDGNTIGVYKQNKEQENNNNCIKENTDNKNSEDFKNINIDFN